MVTATRNKLRHEVFFTQLSAASQRILVLDYDGTLAPFRRNREQAFPYPPVRQILAQILDASNTRVVVSSGRPAQEVVRLLALNPSPEVWGSHGMEHILPDGTYSVYSLCSEECKVLGNCKARLLRRGLGEYLEVKPGGLAIHWRGAEPLQRELIRQATFKAVASYLPEEHLRVLPFDDGIELRVLTPDKGKVVQTIRAESDGSAAIAYLGDDWTDEDAFNALGHAGLSVLVRPEYRSTAAHLWLKPPDELIGFLSMWLSACGGYH